MQSNKNKINFNLIKFLLIAFFIGFSINPVIGFVLVVAAVIFFKNRPEFLTSNLTNLMQTLNNSQFNPAINKSGAANSEIQDTLSGEDFLPFEATLTTETPAKTKNSRSFSGQKKLERRKKYLQIALNSTLDEARDIISQLPASERILIEAGTPLIKEYGDKAISRIKAWAPTGAYIVADNKCADLGSREVEIMANAGANASTCLGVAPIETIDSFIEECEKFGIDSMIDMMNVENSLSVLKKLKKLPNVVILHRGVDESAFSKEKQIPFYQIKQIKGSYNVMVSVAGGDTIKEAQRAIFNDADIVVVWKNFYQSNNETARLAESFLKEVR